MGFYYDTSVKNPMVEENTFIKMHREEAAPPDFEEVRDKLPKPFWRGHSAEIECYWKAWSLAFKNLKTPTKENGFVANYIGTAFNDCLFMWDSVFALMFGKYGTHAFDFQRTLDNLYSKQHSDGFICREIAEPDGTDRFHKHDPSSTGTHVMPWSEWDHYCISGDKERLSKVFPVLVAFHRWLRAYRTWPNGTYWSSGWGSGMDNQPRFLPESLFAFYHGHMVWLDVCLQMVFSAKTLLKMAEILSRTVEMDDFAEEISALSAYVNKYLWDERTSFYYDMLPGGKLSEVKSIGAYWSLLADIVPEVRLQEFVAHLDNPDEFNRLHRIPSLSADTPGYCGDGGYWKGGVWVFTNYPVLVGLTKTGFDSLAHEIGKNHLSNVVKVFERTGTLWENYAPDCEIPGNPAKGDFVGVGGVPPITVLFEYVFGLRPDVPSSSLVWDVRLLEEHGIDSYPFGKAGVLNLKCKARSTQSERPEITVQSNTPVKIELRWEGGSRKEILQF